MIFFIYAIYYYLSKFNLKITTSGARNIKILESHFFAKNRGLILIKVKKSYFFLSFDEKGIKKIKEWNESDWVEDGDLSDKFHRKKDEKS